MSIIRSATCRHSLSRAYSSHRDNRAPTEPRDEHLHQSLKQRLADSGPLFGLWLSLCSADAAEALAHAGFDWLCIDMEHSPNDSRDVVEQLRAIAAAHLPTEPVVRVPFAEGWLVKRVLDAGARTLMFPNVQSAEDAARIVRLTRYPTEAQLEGLRGVAGAARGGIRHAARLRVGRERADRDDRADRIGGGACRRR